MSLSVCFLSLLMIVLLKREKVLYFFDKKNAKKDAISLYLPINLRLFLWMPFYLCLLYVCFHDCPSTVCFLSVLIPSISACLPLSVSAIVLLTVSVRFPSLPKTVLLSLFTFHLFLRLSFLLYPLSDFSISVCPLSICFNDRSISVCPFSVCFKDCPSISVRLPSVSMSVLLSVCPLSVCFRDCPSIFVYLLSFLFLIWPDSRQHWRLALLIWWLNINFSLWLKKAIYFNVGLVLALVLFLDLVLVLVILLSLVLALVLVLVLLLFTTLSVLFCLLICQNLHKCHWPIGHWTG